MAVAALTSVGGFTTAVVGELDWSPLLGISGMNKTQVMAVGGIVLLIGISHAAARFRSI